MKVFISYSHKDKEDLAQLRKHLSVLRQEGSIEDWYDREILAGEEIDTEISEKLESSGMFLLLLSPDFLESPYCVEMEMKRALERHRLNESRVVPIILDYCDWKSTPLGNLKELPEDGKPIREWPNPNSAYLDVVQALRRVLNSKRVPHFSEQPRANVKSSRAQPKRRQYRVKRDFDEIDRNKFQDQAYSTIREHFERSVLEIETMEGLRAHFSKLSATSFTCTVVNGARNVGTAHVTVHRRTQNMGLGDIYYSYEANASPNTAHGMFVIEADNYSQYLRSILNHMWRKKNLSPEEAAEKIWEEFLERAGVTFD